MNLIIAHRPRAMKPAPQPPMQQQAVVKKNHRQADVLPSTNCDFAGTLTTLPCFAIAGAGVCALLTDGEGRPHRYCIRLQPARRAFQ